MAVLIAILAASIIVFFLLLRRQKKNSITDRTKIRKNTKSNWQHSLGRFFQKAPFISREYDRIRERVTLIEPGDIVNANAKATAITARSLLFASIVVVAAVLMAGGDLYFTIAGIFVAYVVFTQSSRQTMDKMELKLLRQFSDFLADIRHYYHDRKMVDEAIYMTFDELPYELSLHIHRIYEVVTSPDVKLEVEKYAQASPNRFFTTFASICVSILDFGDKQLENGSSLFLTNLNYLKEEVQMELLRKQNLNYLFKGLVFVSIFPVIFIKPIELWAKNLMEGMDNIYNGLYGLIAMLLIFLITFVSYTMVCIYKDDHRERVIEESIWGRIAMVMPISALLNREINRHYTRSLVTDTQLKEIGDRTGPKAFLLKRIVYGIVTGIAMLLITISIPFYEKNNIRNNFSEAFSSMSVTDEESMRIMEEVAKLKLGEYEKENPDRDSLTLDIITTTQITQQSYAEMIADEIILRICRLGNTYYRFFYLFLAFAGFLIGFYIPRWFLKYNLKVSQMGKEDEVNQFQTLMLIFMHVDGITLQAILEWMERFSYSFRASITECIMSLAFGEQKALLSMRDKEKHFAPFKRFVDNLLAIDNVGIEAAFDEITTERDYYKEKRRLDNMELSHKKATKARRYAFLPLFSVIGLYLILPMIIASIQMLFMLSNALGV